MSLTAIESEFLNRIKKPCQNQMSTNKVLASVTAAQAIYESKWGAETYISDTNNLFRILIDDEWTGYCYSLDNGKMYEKKTDCTGTDTLIKVFDGYDQCILDWINYIISVRRSKGGPLKYKNIPGVTDYKQCISNYIKDGYVKDHLNEYKDPAYESKMIEIIEKYKLYEWDEEVLSGNADVSITYYVKKDIDDTEALYTTNVLENAEYMAKTNRGYKVFNDTKDLIKDPWKLSSDSPLYRVRMEWDNEQDQLLATKIFEDAKECAAAHPGYKVFAHDNGVLVYDPWEVKETVESNDPLVVEVDVIRAGDYVWLSNTPVYRDADEKNPFIFLTGRFCYFDGKELNGRYRITKSRDFAKVLNGKDPSKIIGMIAKTK